MVFFIIRAIAIAVLMWSTNIASAGVRYRVVYIPKGYCGECSQWADPRDINNLGQVCGFLDRRYSEPRAELWDPATPDTVLNLGGLPDCGSPLASIEGMNDLGHVVGWGGGGDSCEAMAALWTPEAGWFGLGRWPGWRASAAYAVNNLDQAVGLQDPEFVGTAQACLWDPTNGMIDLGRGPLNFDASYAEDINDSTWIVGRGNGPGGFGAFLWTPSDGMSIISDRVWQSTVAINDSGQVVSAEWRSVESRDAFIWDPVSGIHYIGSLPDDETHYVEPLDINNAGTVVGYSSVTPWVEGMDRTSFVWSAQRGMVDLNRRRDPCNRVRELRDLLYAVAINDAGVIVAVPESEFVKAALLIPYIPGDLDENGVCELADLARLLSNFGRQGVGSAEGDLDCQGDVDLQDLAILLLNFGDSMP